MRTALVALVVVALGGFVAPGSGETSQRWSALVYNKQGDLYAVSLDGARTVRLTNTRFQEEAPSVSPDGRKIAFVRHTLSSAFGNLWIMTPGGKLLRKLTIGKRDWSPTWSADGRTIYFVRFLPGSYSDFCGALFRVPARGGRIERVLEIPNGHSLMQPAISPDGRRIAFDDWDACSGGTSQPMLRVTDTAGRPTDDLAHLQNNGYYPNPDHYSAAWSPSGEQIAFVEKGRLSVAARDGSDAHRIGSPHLTIAAAWTHPVWSPDGGWIAAVDSDHGALYVVRPDGSSSRRVIRTGNSTATPSWLPRLPPSR